MSTARRAIHHAQNRQFILENEGQWDFYRPSGGLPEQGLIDWSRQFLRPGDVFLDVGAHCGTWTLQLASVTTSVFAYEPQWSTYCKLCGGVALNRLDAHVIAIHAAVTERVGVTQLHVVSGEGGGSTLHAEDARDTVVRVEDVTGLTLDAERFRYWARGRVGLIKIDVEGAELEVLRGAQRLIDEDAPYLLVECWDTPERTKLFQFVESVLGYRIVPISGYPEMWVCQPPTPRPPLGNEPVPENDSVPLGESPRESTLRDRAPTATALWGGSVHEFAQGLAPPNGERFVHSIPSVCADGDALWTSVRWINYQNDPQGGWVCWDPEGVIRSQAECLRLDPNSLEVLERRLLRPSDDVRAQQPSHASWTRGFEDLRLVRLPDGWAATATATDWNPDYARSEMFLLRFDHAPTENTTTEIDRVVRLCPPPGVNPRQVQKNWVPVHDADEGSLSFVYRTGTVIYEGGSFAGPVDDAPVPLLSDLRGSSQAVALPADLGGGWLYVGHHDHPPDAPHLPHNLTHRLVWLDSAKRAQKASPRFSFLAPGVEYCAGLTLLKDNQFFRDELLFSFAVWERQLWIYRVPLANVLASLVPCTQLTD